MMDSKEFEILMDWCHITAENNRMQFAPILPKDKKVIDDITEKNKLSNLPKEQFQDIVAQHYPLYMAKKKVKQRQLETYSQMSPQQIADLPLEDKVDYIELLFPHIQYQDDFTKTCQTHEDRIKACLYNINFPKSFWNREKQQAERYSSLIANSPDITATVKNWENSSLDDKKQVVLKSAEVFKYVYGDVPEVVFFTPEEEKARKRQNGEDENAHIFAAYYNTDDKKIHFNIERLQDSDNFFALSVMLHEGTHFRQDTQSFNNELVDRLFNSHIERIQNYEKNNRDEAFDFYAMQPKEIHAHAVQEYMENIFAERTGIEKRQIKKPDKETQNIHNKAFTIAKIAQYNSSK